MVLQSISNSINAGPEVPTKMRRRPLLSPVIAAQENWQSYCFYEMVYFISMFSSVVGWSLRREGIGNVPRQGPVLFIANHQSYFDPLIVGLAVRRHLQFVARKSLFRNPAFAFLIRLLNAVPIDQDGIGIEGLRITLQQLEAGKAVIVFPEGERTDDGRIHALQPGIQLLIRKTQAPIVPIGIAGAFDAWPRGQPLPMPAPIFLPAGNATIAVSVGKPLSAQRFLAMPRPQLLEELYWEIDVVYERAEQLRRKP